MKKLRLITFVLVILMAAASMMSCGSGGGKTVKVGASVTPHAEILAAVKDVMAKKGYTLEIIEFSDYVQPNTNLENGELDANYFQHKPYMNDFNAENGTHLVSVADIHYEPFGIYAGKSDSLDKIKAGTTISIPNDGTNEARALMLLESLGYITLKEGANFTATKLDIASYKVDIKIEEIEAAQLVRSLADVDFAVINGNYAIQGGLNAATDALAIENKDSTAAQTYANIIAVKEGRENDEGILALIEALKSDTVKEYINTTYGGAVVPMF